jgi:hypothetical protein
LLSTLAIVRNVLRHEDVTLRAPYHNGQSSFSFIDILHSRETERLNLFGWRGLEIESDCAGFVEFKEIEDTMLSFSRFEARGAASPLHGEVYSDEARLAWSYAQTVSRTHSSMRLSSSASTSWVANSSESWWARSR